LIAGSTLARPPRAGLRGHTNAETGGKLFISAKTVDHHVSAVLRKLQAPTREAAAVRAARPELLRPRR
jgi:DNA-binding CsgD family transcriptional regulator